MTSAKQNRQISWSQTIRDVLIASMNRGQFPLAVVSLIVIVMILKMPGEDVSKLVFSIVSGLEDWSLFGYLMFFVSTAGWFLHTRWQRKGCTSEIERISNERNKAQAQKLGKKVKSSKEIL